MNSTLLEIHLADRVLDEGYQRSVLELEIVVGRAGEHVAHPANQTAVLFYLETDELEDVVRAWSWRRQLGAGYRQHLAALHGPIELDREPPTADATT
ncbi:MAG: hypothetical protein ABI927_00965 [Gaiellaceae bacterium]